MHPLSGECEVVLVTMIKGINMTIRAGGYISKYDQDQPSSCVYTHTHKTDLSTRIMSWTSTEKSFQPIDKGKFE